MGRLSFEPKMGLLVKNRVDPGDRIDLPMATVLGRILIKLVAKATDSDTKVTINLLDTYWEKKALKAFLDLAGELSHWIDRIISEKELFHGLYEWLPLLSLQDEDGNGNNTPNADEAEIDDDLEDEFAETQQMM